LLSSTSGPARLGFVFAVAELARCRQVHSAYIPELVTLSGFWWHTAAQPFNRRRIVCAAQAGFSLVRLGAPSRIRTCAHGSGGRFDLIL
jgi:hypothetical protein